MKKIFNYIFQINSAIIIALLTSWMTNNKDGIEFMIALMGIVGLSITTFINIFNNNFKLSNNILNNLTNMLHSAILFFAVYITMSLVFRVDNYLFINIILILLMNLIIIFLSNYANMLFGKNKILYYCILITILLTTFLLQIKFKVEFIKLITASSVITFAAGIGIIIIYYTSIKYQIKK